MNFKLTLVKILSLSFRNLELNNDLNKLANNKQTLEVLRNKKSFNRTNLKPRRVELSLNKLQKLLSLVRKSKV